MTAHRKNKNPPLTYTSGHASPKALIYSLSKNIKKTKRKREKEESTPLLSQTLHMKRKTKEKKQKTVPLLRGSHCSSEKNSFHPSLSTSTSVQHPSHLPQLCFLLPEAHTTNSKNQSSLFHCSSSFPLLPPPFISSVFAHISALKQHLIRHHHRVTILQPPSSSSSLFSLHHHLLLLLP